MTRKRILTIDVSDDIERIVDILKKSTIDTMGKNHWDALDKVFMQRMIFSKIEDWYMNLNTTKMNKSIESDLMAIIIRS